MVSYKPRVLWLRFVVYVWSIYLKIRFRSLNLKFNIPCILWHRKSLADETRFLISTVCFWNHNHPHYHDYRHPHRIITNTIRILSIVCSVQKSSDHVIETKVAVLSEDVAIVRLLNYASRGDLEHMKR